MKKILVLLALVFVSGCAITPAVTGTAVYDSATGGVDVGVAFELKEIWVEDGKGGVKRAWLRVPKETK